MAWFYLAFLFFLMFFAYLDYFYLLGSQASWMDSHLLVFGVLILFLLLPLTIHWHGRKRPKNLQAQRNSHH